MVSKIIVIGVILWCLAVPCRSTAAQWNDDSQFSERSDQIQYRLPNDTKPETYNISLRTGISKGEFNYNGFISINILVVNATREVTIHSQALNIQSVRLSNDTGSIDLLPWRSNNVTDFLIIPTKSAELFPGSRYRLDLKFSGELRNRSRGFYRALSENNAANQRYCYLIFQSENNILSRCRSSLFTTAQNNYIMNKQHQI